LVGLSGLVGGPKSQGKGDGDWSERFHRELSRRGNIKANILIY
jgi:hypothetical protein